MSNIFKKLDSTSRQWVLSTSPKNPKGRHNMSGTRSAPTVDGGTPNRVRLSTRWMDAGGEKRAVSLDVPASITDAQIDSLVNTTQILSNATCYEINKILSYTSIPLETNAETDSPFVSVYDNLVLLVKDPTINKAQDMFIPAIEGIVVLDGDVIDTTDTDYIAFRNAVVSAVGGSYQAVTARFTERRDKNDSVPA